MKETYGEWTLTWSGWKSAEGFQVGEWQSEHPCGVRLVMNVTGGTERGRLYALERAKGQIDSRDWVAEWKEKAA